MRLKILIILISFNLLSTISFGGNRTSPDGNSTFLEKELQSAGQDSVSRNWTLNGYVTNMQSFMFQRWDGDWISDNLSHNRLNFKWHNNSNNLNVVVEMRNRFIIGESVKSTPGYAQMFDSDNGFVKLSANIFSGNSYVFNSKIDRAFIDYTKEKFQVRVGRQRINWGQCFTWNPNDLFNAYSFLDFDYAEKPGSDAIRLQYYGNSTSALDFAIKLDKNRKVTSALLYRFNKWNYDIQFLGGILNEEDFVLGTGWSGNILNASFRGEVSYFHPKKNFADTSGVFSVSLGSEHAFKNSFVLQFEMLYRQDKSPKITSFADYYNMNLSAKNLSFTDFSIMMQGSYPVTPLFNVSLAVMYFPRLNGIFIGPNLSYSITGNLDFSLIAQSFSGQFIKGHTDHFNMGFLRLKWSF